MGNILKKGKLKKQVSHWKLRNTYSDEYRPISDLFSSSIVNLDDNFECDCKTELSTSISVPDIESLKTIDACSTPQHSDYEHHSVNIPSTVKETGDATHKHLQSSNYEKPSHEEGNTKQLSLSKQQSNQIESVSNLQKTSNSSKCDKFIQCTIGRKRLRNKKALESNHLDKTPRINGNHALMSVRRPVHSRNDALVLSSTQKFVSRLNDNHPSIMSEISDPFQIVSTRSESQGGNGTNLCLKNYASYCHDIQKCTLKAKRVRQSINRQNCSLHREMKNAHQETNSKKEQSSIIEVSQNGDSSDVSSMKSQPKDARCILSRTKRFKTRNSRDTEDEVSFSTVCSGNDHPLISSGSDKNSKDFSSLEKYQKNVNSRLGSCKKYANEVTTRQSFEKESRFHVIRVIGNIEELKRHDPDDSIIFHYRFLVKPDRDFWRIFACSLDRRIESICRQSHCRIHVRNVRADSFWKDEIAEISIFSETLHNLEKCCKLFDYRFPAFLASSGLGLMQ